MVSADHFRRLLDKEDIIALSLHPIMQAAIERVATQRVEALLAAGPQPVLAKPGGRPRYKVPPPGYLTYADVEAEFGLSNASLRSYISRGLIAGGRGLVRRTEIERFMRNHTFKFKKVA